MNPQEQADYDRLKSKLEDQVWRLNNLYTIKNPQGAAVPFRLNWAQRTFLSVLHYFNVVLKARQLGFTTFIMIYFLDACLFNSNHKCGVIAQSLKDAQELFEDKIKFAYDNLPGWLRKHRTCTTDRVGEIKFNNGSSIGVGTSLRGGTLQKLHVSEYGKISAKTPDKATEIKTGALNTVHTGQQIFVESTAEGRSGEFFDLVKLARRLQDENRTLTPLDPKFHFYPWYENPDYTLGDQDTRATPLTSDDVKYFRELYEEHGIELTAGQRAWYVKKEQVQQDDMKREYPSTPDEAFEASMAGAYYTRQMAMVRKRGQIRKVPHDPRHPVFTFWDLGLGDNAAVWFFQFIGGEYRFIRFYQESGWGFDQHWREMQTFGYSYGAHFFPHDGTNRQQTPQGVMTNKKIAETIGIKPVVVVKRTKSLQVDISVCRGVLPLCYFDESNAAAGIACLDNYRKDWDDGVGDWKKTPRHDEFSHGADAFRTFAVGYEPRIGEFLEIDSFETHDDSDVDESSRSTISGY